MVYKSDGRRLGLTDKPYARVTDEFGDEIRQVRRDGRAQGLIDELYLVTEYARDPVKLFNAELMWGCRDADQEADEDAHLVVGEMRGDMTLRALTDRINMGPRGFRALVRLIRSGDLVQLANTKLSYDSKVRRGKRRHD